MLQIPHVRGPLDRPRKTWEYLSTVAYDPNIGLESFCEADLLTLPGGEILCFMRTGGSGGKHTPLYLSRSGDDGKTWSTPQPIADRGVWPNACRLHNGVLVCTYGRPGNWLAFSLDEGGPGPALLFLQWADHQLQLVEEVARTCCWSSTIAGSSIPTAICVRRSSDHGDGSPRRRERTGRRETPLALVVLNSIRAGLCSAPRLPARIKRLHW